MELPGWYVQLAANEAELDARIVAQRSPVTCKHLPEGICDGCSETGIVIEHRRFCGTCGLFHRAVCPSGPGVADILSAPTPEPSLDLPCEEDDES